MKTRNFFLFMLVVMLASGLAFVSCDSSGDDGSIDLSTPRLLNLYFVSAEDSRNNNWRGDRSSFPPGFEINYLLHLQNAENDVVRKVWTLSRGGNIFSEVEGNFLAPADPRQVPGVDLYTWIGYGRTVITEPGTYRKDIYVVDVKGNRSNTITRTFTIN